MTQIVSPVQEGHNRASGSERTVCHLASIPENIEIIIETIERLSQTEIHLYTASHALIKQVEALEIDGKAITPHLVEPAYPEQWIFRLSREISEKRVLEALQAAPGNLTLNKNPDSQAFQKLAIRRLSLSCLYMEVSILVSVIHKIQPGAGDSLIFLSNYLDIEDLQDEKRLWPFLPAIQIILISSKVSNYKPAPVQALKRKPVHQAGIAGVVQTERPRAGFSVVLSELNQRYKTNRERFPFKTLRKLESSIRKARVRFQGSLQKGRFQISCHRKKLQAWLRHPKSSGRPPRVLFALCSLQEQKKQYIARIVGPLLRRMQDAGWDCSFLINTQNKALTEDFRREIQKYGTGMVDLLTMMVLPDTQKIFKKLYQKNIYKLPPGCLSDASTQRERINNTLGSITSIKYLLAAFYEHVKELSFEIVIGREEDLEVVSMLHILKPVLKRKYKTFILPSCLPECSECYDCVSVDELCVSLDFVREIFEDQNLNAGRISVVGSLEWEEPPHGKAGLPPGAKRLLEQSSFVLGVVHQPIYVTMHGQALYNGLTMNIFDIYERFLKNHPNACILIRPHPTDDLPALRKCLEGMERTEILPYETSASAFYGAIHAALSMHSTMVTHTMAHGIPVLSMYQYPDYHRMYDFMEKLGGCFATDSNDEALAWLARLQSEPDFYAQIRSRMTVFKEQCLSVPASEKMMVRLGADQRGLLE